VAATETTPVPTTSTSSHRIPLTLRSVGLKSMRDQRLSLPWWTGSTAALAAIVVMLYPSIDGGEELEALFEQLPGPIQAMIGENIDLSTPAGYLDLRMFTTIAPIIFLIYAIWRGMAAISGEENRGTMDLLLAHPVRRWRIVVENAASMLSGLVLIGMSVWIGLVAGGLIMDVEFSYVRAGYATVMGILLGMVFGGISLSIGAHTGKSGRAIGVSAAIAIGTYLLHTLAPLVDWLEPARYLSPFYYYIGHSAMLQGFNATYAMVLALISLAFVAIATMTFQRRDIQV
jgi:ABC-2 type transport system permease protein